MLKFEIHSGRAGDRGGEALRSNSARGFTLIELAIAVAIIGTLAGIALPLYLEYLEQAKIAKACMDIRVIEKEIQVYRLQTGHFPDSLAAIGRSNFTDSWGAPYKYLKISDNEKAVGKARKDRFMVPINTDFDLYSSGKDGGGSTPLTAKGSHDDVIRAFNGAYVGLASKL